MRIEFPRPIVSDIPRECQQPGGPSRIIKFQHPHMRYGEQWFTSGFTSKDLPFEVMLQFLPDASEGDLPALISCIYQSPGLRNFNPDFMENPGRSKSALIVRVGDLDTSREFCRCDSAQADGADFLTYPLLLLPKPVRNGIWGDMKRPEDCDHTCDPSYNEERRCIGELESDLRYRVKNAT